MNEINYNEKPNILKAIIFSILAFLGFYLAMLIIALILSVVFLVLSKIPIVSIIVSKIDYEYITVLFSGVITKVIIEALNKNIPTRKIAFILTGIYLIILNVVSLIANIAYREAILTNILVIIAGIIFFIRGKSID